ncbi:MAG: transposase [Firmicutes bacterium]|nr:transposase [Bacillota bacterium]
MGLNREIARRFDVVAIFAGREAVLRLGGAVLAEQDDEWLTSRRYFSEESMALVIEAGRLCMPALEKVAPLAQSA